MARKLSSDRSYKSSRLAAHPSRAAGRLRFTPVGVDLDHRMKARTCARATRRDANPFGTNRHMMRDGTLFLQHLTLA